MGDLKTPFDNAIYPNTTDLAGDLAVSRGSDPNADGGDGPAAIQDFWETGPYPWPSGTPGQALPEDPAPSTAETANSVSGLPALPNRFQPSDNMPNASPSLEDRNPGTIDKR